MQNFSVGLMSFAGAILLPVIYIIGRQIRRFTAWVERGNSPKERVGAMIVIFTIVGFVIGSLAQPLWDKSKACQAEGQPVMTCVFFPPR